MALNKNFVVKNGVEVATNLIYAEGSVGKVGIGVTQPGAKLEVAGNIVGVALTLTGSTDGTDALYTGITTSNRGLDVGSGGTSIHVDVTNNSIGFNSTSPDTDFVLDVQPGVGQSAATFGGALDVQGNTWINGDLEVSGAIDGTFTINLDNTVITGVVTANDAEIYKQFDIINNSNIAYQFQSTGIGFTQNTDDPTLFLNRGEKYHFNLNATGHPFYIKTTRSTGSGDQYTAGVTNNGAQVGVVTFYVPYNAPSELFYQCGAHSGMGNTMYVLKDSPAGVSTETFVTDNLYVTGVSTFIGNARFDGDIDANGNIYLGDTETIYLGDANDLQIYHNGSNSYIDDSGTGSLIFKSNIYSFRNTGDSEQIAKFNENGSVELYYDNSKKLETTSTGITVTGTVSATSFNGSLTGNADTATNSTNVNLLARNTENATHYVTFGTSTTGNQRLNTDTGLTYNPSTNTLTATTFSGNATTATNTTNITVADESSDTTCFPVFTTAATGNLPPKSGTNLTFNSSSGTLTASSFSGDGANVTNINADNISSGIVTTARLSSGTASADTFLNGHGQFIEAGGGAWNLLSTTTTSAASTIDINSNIDSTYDTYVIKGIIYASAHYTRLRCQFYNNGTILTGTNYYSVSQRVMGNNNSVFEDNRGEWGLLTYASVDPSTNGLSGSSDELYHFEIELDRPSQSRTRYAFKLTGWMGAWYVNRIEYVNGVIAYNNDTTALTNINGIRLLPSTGTLTGTFKLYGIN